MNGSATTATVILGVIVQLARPCSDDVVCEIGANRYRRP